MKYIKFMIVHKDHALLKLYGKNGRNPAVMVGTWMPDPPSHSPAVVGQHDPHRDCSGCFLAAGSFYNVQMHKN